MRRTTFMLQCSMMVVFFLAFLPAGAGSARAGDFPDPAPVMAPAAAPHPGAPVVAQPAADSVAPAEPIDPSAPTVGASLDRTEAHVGDRLTLTVSAVARDAIFSSLKLVGLDLGQFEVLDTSDTDLDLGDGKKSKRFVLQVAAYELGELEIPPIAVEYRGAEGEAKQVKTAAIPVLIGPTVEDPHAEMQPLQKARGLLVEDRRWVQGLIGAGFLFGLLVVSLLVRALLRRRRAGPRIANDEIRRPPHEVALERLLALRLQTACDADPRPFHFELAEVLRDYLGGRFGFDSLELTTTELLAELAPLTMAHEAGPAPLESERTAATTPAIVTIGSPAPLVPRLDPAEAARIAAFFEACDLVKFAQAPSSDEAALHLVALAEAIVRATMAEPSSTIQVKAG